MRWNAATRHKQAGAALILYDITRTERNYMQQSSARKRDTVALLEVYMLCHRGVDGLQYTLLPLIKAYLAGVVRLVCVRSAPLGAPLSVQRVRWPPQ